MTRPDDHRAPAATLRLLGAPALSTAAGETPFAPERPFQLLAYLAVKGGWVRRDALADLLYPGRPLDAARNNLRKVLLLARRVEGVGSIEQNGELLRWQPPSDLQRFEAACDAGRHAEALAAYGSPLLLGLDAGAEQAWHAWVAAERGRLASRWRDAALQRLAELDGDPLAAEALAQALLREDPLDDEAMHALLAAQGRQGRRTEALQALAGYAEQLSSTLGLAPSAALERLGQSLRSGSVGPPQPPEEPIIGRRTELMQIEAQLARPECRVLSMLAPGGMGKTVLARTAYSALCDSPGRFPGGGAWVELEPLGQAEQVPARIAEAWGLVLAPQQEGWAALTQALRPTAHLPRLLVLDNLEHLALAAPLAALLAALPGLKVLATSRVALGIAGEWRFVLGGLPLPDDDETDPEVLRANDAVRLFERHALPLAPDFNLAQEAADVVRLVREVEGMPLAIRLLAAWRRLMPVREIVLELAGSLDVLEPSTPQERSVRTAFERSWRMLGPLEQRVLGQMARVPQPVDRAMLRAVLAAPLPVLAALVDRSLVRADGDGRFSLHPMIRRCAQPLAVEAEALGERHARHVAAGAARGSALRPDALAHVRAAWDWAVDHGDAAVLGALARPLTSHLLDAGLRDEAAVRLEAALGAVDAPRAGNTPDGTSQSVTGPAALMPVWNALHSALGKARFHQGRLDEAFAHGQAALLGAQHSGQPHQAAQALSVLASVHWMRGEYEQARDAGVRQVAALQDAGAPPLDLAAPLGAIGLALKNLGRYDEALQHYRQAVDLARAHGRLHDFPVMLLRLGNLLRSMGRLDEALATLGEALASAQAHARHADLPGLHLNIAIVHESRGEHAAAWSSAHQAVEDGRRYNTPSMQAAALLCRARVAAVRARAGAAAPMATSPEADLREALGLWRQLGSTPLAVQCLCTAGLVLATQAGLDGSSADDGLAIVLWAMEHPAFVRSEREDAAQRLARLQPSAGQIARARSLLPPETPLEAVLARLPAGWLPG